jgi:hypothetical protein
MVGETGRGWRWIADVGCVAWRGVAWRGRCQKEAPGLFQDQDQYCLLTTISQVGRWGGGPRSV